jgi:bla regulator protein blaR1
MKAVPVLLLIALVTLAQTRPAIAQPPPPLLPPSGAACSASLADDAPSAAPVAVPSLDVVSVKPDMANGNWMRLGFTPDGLRFTNIPVHMLLTQSSQTNDDQIIGEPSWTKTDRFDVDAKVAGPDVAMLSKLNSDQRAGMLTQVLTDRFQMKSHTETRELPIYILVIAKDGPKLKEANEPKPDPDNPCPRRGPWFQVSRGSMTLKNAKLQFFLPLFSQQLGRTIIDKTGLTGSYDFTLNWVPDEGTPDIPGAPPPTGHSLSPDQSGPSVFTAIQEQLGLKLESGKGPVNVMVIDHIEKPAEN